METTVKRFRRYAELTGVSMKELATQIDLNWLTVRKVLREDKNISNLTEKKLKNFLDEMTKEIEKV